MEREIFIDSFTLNFVGSRYLEEKLKREYAVLDQISDFLQVCKYVVKKGEILVIFTTLSKKKFMKVLADLQISPASVEFERVGIFQKLVRIRF